MDDVFHKRTRTMAILLSIVLHSDGKYRITAVREILFDDGMINGKSGRIGKDSPVEQVYERLKGSL